MGLGLGLGLGFGFGFGLGPMLGIRSAHGTVENCRVTSSRMPSSPLSGRRQLVGRMAVSALQVVEHAVRCDM